MSPSPDVVTVLGRFPPPIDGQALATRRLADLLAAERPVHRVDLSAGDRRFAESAVRFRPAKVVHSLRAVSRLRSEFPETGPVLWTSVSPSRLGHLRDRLIVLPALSERHAIFGVVHWGNFDRVFRDPLTRRSAAGLVERLRGFVFLNRLLADRCAAWIPDAKRLIVPNTVDRAVLCTPEEIEAKAGSVRERRLRLLFLSNMTPSKGHADVLEAVRLLHAGGLPVTAQFAGRWESPSDAEQFSASLRRHGLDDVVRHLGPVAERERIRRLYLDADVFLLPTYYPTEAQPLSIIEALNAGTPVVTTRHAGIPEMVDDEQGALFVPPRAPEAIAEAVRRFADAAWWAAQVRLARRRFETTFHPDVVRRRWCDLLDAAR